MLRIGPQLLALASPLWIAVASAALLAAIICALGFRRRRRGFTAALGRLFLIGLAAAVSGSLTWAIFSWSERNALQGRAEQLTVQALAPGSPLACLSNLTGESVQGACERELFASPANVARAVSYVAAQFALLSDMTDYADHGGANIADLRVPLRHALEADPFGFLAYVLVTRGCTSENCRAFALLDDPRHVRTNIIAQTLSHYLDQYRDAWARASESPAAAMPDMGPASTETIMPGRRKASADVDFPSAASIPPVSIMNPEPKGPPNTEAAGRERAREGVDPVWTPAPAQAAK